MWEIVETPPDDPSCRPYCTRSMKKSLRLYPRPSRHFSNQFCRRSILNVEGSVFLSIHHKSLSGGNIHQNHASILLVFEVSTRDKGFHKPQF